MAPKPQKTGGITAEILACIEHSQPGFRPWIERVDPDTRAELEAIRARYCAGDLDVQQKSLARGIAKVLADRGMKKIPSTQVVATWLRNGR